MKLAIALIGLMALGACVAKPPMKITATHANLDSEATEIVDGFIDLIHGIVESKGDINEISDLLFDIRKRIESKIQTNGPSYLETLGKTLTNIELPNDSLQNIITAITRMVEDDGGVNVKKNHRAKRSPTWGKKGYKKGKKGYKKKKC